MIYDIFVIYDDLQGKLIFFINGYDSHYSIIIEILNENFHSANLVVETTPGFLPNEKQLELQWKQAAEERAEVIRQVTRLNWEAYWQYLVKPHNQFMTLKHIIVSVEKMVPTLINVVFTRQLKAKVSQPTLLRTMLDICDLKD